MYYLKEEKKDELFGTTNITKLAERIGVTNVYLYNIISRKLPCKKHLALLLIATQKNVLINEELLEEYFTREEK